MYKFFHRHHCESSNDHDSMTEIIVLINVFIVFHSVLVHCGTLIWFIDIGEYHINAQALFSIKKIIITLIMKLQKIFLLISFIILMNILFVKY